jgi:hypothetical protein
VHDVLARSLQQGLGLQVEPHHMRREPLAVVLAELGEESVFQKVGWDRSCHSLPRCSVHKCTDRPCAMC